MKTTKFYEEVEQVVDHKTGEITEEKRVYKRQIEKEKFMMVYLESISGILKINSPIEYKVLLALWEMSEFETNRVILVKPIKEALAAKLKYGFKTVENSISRLAKKDLLVKKGAGIYFLNPKYFFKGSEIARSNAIKIIFDFSLTDKNDNDEQSKPKASKKKSKN